jgi:hypothetical protein
MAAKLGQVAYICLSEAFEDPRWREGLVVGIRHHTVQLVVRSNDVKELGPDIAHFEHKKVSFFLLECPATHLRAACNNRPLCLGVDSGDLLTEGKIYVESDPELQFATASDPEPVAAGRKKGSKMKEPDSDASSSGSESEEDLVGMLSKMQKSWRGRDSGEGRGSSSSRHLTGGKRFSFLDKDNKKSKGSKMVEPTSTQKILDSLDTEKDPIKMLVALQLAQHLQAGEKKARRHRSRSASRESADSRSASSDRSLSSGRKRSGHARAIENYHGARRRMFKRPLHHVRRYVREVERHLGASDRPYRLSELGKKISWGKQKSLQRVHYMMSEVLELMLKGQMEKACLQQVLCLRAVHQTALDQGDWEVSWMITHLENPFSRPRWGGDEAELGKVAAYLRSMAELEKSTAKLRAQSYYTMDRAEDPAKPGNPNKKGKKGKGRGKAEKEEEGAEKA